MSEKNSKTENELASLDWLKIKTDKGKTPDFVIRSQMEDPGNKFLRKFKENPLVPIGALLTVGFLSYGLRDMYRGDKMRSQMMMRGRIAAQGFTVVALLGGLFYKGLAVMKEAEKEEKSTND
ncbi:HIG1 domain family member 2A [Daktulosphaira vitifoliae]|uniref:HIG1 domain family member 2A n=1 Tax=Daktulosphaira vitifoliae TaxID=58002 RepID=UPI0021AAC051|nr:HIG1 domain family member 2A [Daktulosphaira vitifoliae]